VKELSPSSDPQKSRDKANEIEKGYGTMKIRIHERSSGKN
jgi:hypothetical protein